MMRYYAKLKANADESEVLQQFRDAGACVSDVILDLQIQQKKAGSLYLRLKEELVLTGGTLCVDSLFSLGKNAREVAKELEWFASHNIDVFVLDLPSTLNPNLRTVDILYEVNVKYAEREIEHIKEGRKRAAASGKVLSPGRPRVPYPDNWEEGYNQWQEKKISSAEFLAMTGLSQGTFYNLLRHYKEELLAQKDNPREKAE